MQEQSISNPVSTPYGYCHCGCGEKTTIIVANSANRGEIAGAPRKFIHGHNNTRPRPRSAGGRIPLSDGQFAIVDPSDVFLVEKHRWAAHSGFHTTYATSEVNGKYVAMHRLILGISDPDEVVDHINHNGLDNRRCNLRVGTAGNNAMNARKQCNNTTGYIGVTFEFGRYRARVRKDRKTISLGFFDTAEDAARARDHAAIDIFGEWAELNFP